MFTSSPAKDRPFLVQGKVKTGSPVGVFWDRAHQQDTSEQVAKGSFRAHRVPCQIPFVELGWHHLALCW